MKFNKIVLILILNLVFYFNNFIICFNDGGSGGGENIEKNNYCQTYLSNYLNEKCVQFSIVGIDSENLNQESLKGNLKLLEDQQILIPVGNIINSLNSNLKTFCNNKGLLQPISDHLKIKDFKLLTNGTIKINDLYSQLNCLNPDIINFKLNNFSYLFSLKGFQECPSILNIGEPCNQNKNNGDGSDNDGLLSPISQSNLPKTLPLCQPRDNPLESNYCPGSFETIEKNNGKPFDILLNVSIVSKGLDKFGDNYYQHKVIVTNHESYGVKDVRIHSLQFLQYVPYHPRYPNGDFLVPKSSSLLGSGKEYTFIFNCTHQYPSLSVVNLVRGIPPPQYS
ncbi:hypothetical protein DDB_G0286373 [Dictyostelium discoideum AX4]|uniref:Uncharacterized protein n=1 Tax=Dictyostelium discoideum TaxID=44689 RepID=Q54LW9_DICDI|nr:hypothetical protein DDB_G0286373 [Dictyostelium discoideum AX4]EAL64211.1 hypothetical protein DDB_G0286373 [Dictyostelium discoideum AX4]|eukprot:XP_637711.1 hypothetical protein DDB_G0286373 [Dictyostelium discoideum AX4]